MKGCCTGSCRQGRDCSRRQNDTIGKVAGGVLVGVMVIAFVCGIALAQTQDAIDAAVAEQQQMACFKYARMCAAAEARK